MSVFSLYVALQASRHDGRVVTAEQFLVPLDIKPGEAESVHADGSEWQAGLVCFGVVRFSHFADVHEVFLAAGRFLARRSPEVTTAMRAAGLSLRLFVEIGMDQDQMELELPPELLAACSQHHLGVHLLSNDTAA